MRYLKNDLFISAEEKPFQVEWLEEGISKHDAPVCEVLALVLTMFNLNHALFVRQGTLLNLSETECFNRLRALLKAAKEEAWVAIESEDFKLLEKMLGLVMPTVPWHQNWPLLNKALKNSPEKPPESPNPAFPPASDASLDGSKPKADVPA